MEIGRFTFLRPPLGDLGATYNDSLRLIGKRVVDYLLALIELFSLGVTAEERAIIGWKSAISFQRGSVDPKFHVEGVAPHQPFFFSEKWDKCSFVWYINLDRSFYRFVTMHACDGHTDRQTDGRTVRRTEFSLLYRVCITCSAVIKLKLRKWVLEKKVFSCLLKDGSELAEVTTGGRLFRMQRIYEELAGSQLMYRTGLFKAVQTPVRRNAYRHYGLFRQRWNKGVATAL